MNDGTCGCFFEPNRNLVTQRELGMDENFAEVSLLTCPDCETRWLRYTYEMEAFTASGRWYLGALSEQEAARLTLENAKTMLEELVWYYYGGSYYGVKSGRSSGKIGLNL